MKRAHSIDAAMVFVIALLVVVLYGKVTQLWWTYDDANILRLVIENPLRAFFTDGALWPQKLFTPLEPVIYRAQLSGFGLDPGRWFVAHLFMAIASATCIYVAARMYLPLSSSLVTAVLYVAAVPFCSLITQLSVTHYFQSIVLAALSFALYVRSVRTNRLPLAVISALFYLASMLAKEIAVPMVVLLLMLPERDVRTRARFATPHVIALAAYLAWRWTVLGTLLGGYGWAVRTSDWISLVATAPGKLLVGMTGPRLGIGLLFMIPMILVALGVLRNQRAALIFITAAVLAVAPIIPVSKEMQPRYVIVPWIVLCVAFVFGVEALRRDPRMARAAKVLLVLLPFLAVVPNRLQWWTEFARIRRMSDEGRVFWGMRAGSLLRHPIVPPAAMGELNWLKTVYAKRPAGAGWFYDDLFLCAGGYDGRHVWQYDDTTRTVVDITSNVPAMLKQSCGSVRNDVPLTAAFHYEDGALFWTFGPYKEGQWRVVIGNGVQAFDLPRQDGFRLPLDGISLRVRYASPAGWVTYSPEIALDFVHHPDLTWRR